ncbi:uncharacterized protein LOC126161776 [Schistocerca cancellata]|uniref:uncharacterized protein LOC126161776 n=1 Tax=Schistocerca cancellata TaxID=274614 RepID=UPI002117A384|nr:uncharacterized protein LOC126161776 [Schistocerca cancellata]
MCGDLLMEDTFYSNCCHVCKLHQPDVDVKRCSKCRLISYCSVKHQKKHWPKHKDLCKSIVRICHNSGVSALFEHTNAHMTAREWCTLRTKYMAAAEVFVARKLCKYEREMFFFPRVCRVCKMFNNGDLIDCGDCLSASYCSVDHQLKDSTNHSGVCNDLKLCLEIDTKVKNDLDFSTLMVTSQEEYTLLPKNTIDFIQSHITFDKLVTLPQQLVFAYVSELFSCPLTLLYALERERIMRASLIVHVVGASYLECSSFFSWESVLHWLPHLKYLSVVFIGPDVIEGKSFTLCSGCEKNGKGINIKLYSGMYHDFVKSVTYETPSIIVAYNSGIDEQSSHDTWGQSIPFFLKYDAVPFVLTSYTLSEAISDLNKICEIAGCEITISVSCERNRFSSQRPYRDWETDPLCTFCYNNYLSIVKRGSESTK